MTEVLSMKVESRAGVGKGGARATRRGNRIPAVIYGDKQPATPISLDPLVMKKLFFGGGFLTKLVDLELDGKKIRTLPRDVQQDPVKDTVIHADFMRVTEKTRIRVDVPVHAINETKSPGIKRGGVLNIVEHYISVTCLASDIPTHFTVDLDGMDIGDSVHLSQLQMPKGVTPAHAERDLTIIAVNPPTVVKEDEPAPGAAAATAAAGAEGAAAAAPAAAAAGGAAAPAAATGKDGKAAAPAPAKK